MFVRNPTRWETYTLFDNQLIVNTFDYREEFIKRLNRTYVATIRAYNDYVERTPLTLIFAITFSPMEDMSTYFISSSDFLNTSYVYGDDTFREIISNHFSGPNKVFGRTPLHDLR